ncbi:hypothetical protein [Aliikangiella maris]
MPICNNCGSNNWEVTPDIGALEKLKCLNCGWEGSAHANSPKSHGNPYEGEALFKLQIYLNKNINVKQIAELKKKFRVFELMTTIEIKKAVMQEKVIELGNFPSTLVELSKQKLADIHLQDLLKIEAIK